MCSAERALYSAPQTGAVEGIQKITRRPPLRAGHAGTGVVAHHPWWTPLEGPVSRGTLMGKTCSDQAIGTPGTHGFQADCAVRKVRKRVELPLGVVVLLS